MQAFSEFLKGSTATPDQRTAWPALDAAEQRLRLEIHRQSPSKVLAAVRRLKPAPNDTVVFYFTGHGGLDDRRPA